MKEQTATPPTQLRNRQYFSQSQANSEGGKGGLAKERDAAPLIFNKHERESFPFSLRSSVDSKLPTALAFLPLSLTQTVIVTFLACKKKKNHNNRSHRSKGFNARAMLKHLHFKTRCQILGRTSRGKQQRHRPGRDGEQMVLPGRQIVAETKTDSSANQSSPWGLL